MTQPIDLDPAYSSYPRQCGSDATTETSAADLWRVVCGFGNDGDFFYAGALWWLRRVLDRAVGGPSFRRAYRHPAELRLGDCIDGWRVIALEPEKRLTLLMEMKAPGTGVLEFTIDDDGGHRRVSMRAHWQPVGAWGSLYWYALLPAHAFLFRGSTREIVRRATSACTL